MKCNKCKIKEQLEKAEKCEDCGEAVIKEYPVVWPKWATDTMENQGCMHRNCPGCKAGTCSGVHMMSCPCPSCSPRM